MEVDLPQRQRCKTNRPQEEPPNPGFAAWDQEGVGESVAETGVGDPHHLVHPAVEGRIGVAALQLPEVEAVTVEHVSRQPAGVAFPIVPDVLENVGHLQTLTEADGPRHQRLAPGLDPVGV